MIVVDPDPNNDGDASDATIVGRLLLVSVPAAAADDAVTGNAGMGGQGILPIPVVYNGWVQRLPEVWKAQLTAEQINPLPVAQTNPPGNTNAAPFRQTPPGR